jgi:anti-repressor protein
MHNLVINKNGKLLTSSRKVAEKFGREHKDVLKAIRNMDCSAEFHGRNFAPIDNQEVTHSPVIQNKEYAITRDGFTFLVMGFTGSKAAKFKEEFIQAFNEMEEQLKKPEFDILSIVNNPDLLISLGQKLKSQKSEIDRLTPKAELMDRVMATDNSLSISQTAKVLGLPYGRNKLFQILRQRGLLFKNKNEPYQQYVEAGYFKLKENLIERPGFESFTSVQVFVTQKGLGFISKKIGLLQPEVKEMKLV